MIQFLKKLFGKADSIKMGDLIASGAIIVDVRTPGEFRNGHLKNSVNVPLDMLQSRLATLDKCKPIITCCASGIRSASAQNTLKAAGFNDVYNGGSWVSLRGFVE